MDNAPTERGETPPDADASPEPTPSERRFLLGLARRAVEAAVRHEPRPRVDADDLTPALKRPADTFVTLYEHGDLRGCIGSRTGSQPLYEAVIENAGASATRDPRFPAVLPSELRDLVISISVLTPPRALSVSGPDDLRDRLQPFVHGVTIQSGTLRALYLPQVWDHFAGDADIVASFLTSLSRKAGDFSGKLWQQPGTRFEVFEAVSFGEGDAPE